MSETTRKQSRKTLSTIVVILLILSLFGLLLYLSGKAVKTQKDIIASMERAQQIQDEIERNNFPLAMSLAFDAVDLPPTPQMKQALNQLWNTYPTPNLILDEAKDQWYVDWSPDGSKFLTWGYQNPYIYIWDATSGYSLTRIELQYDVQTAEWDETSSVIHSKDITFEYTHDGTTGESLDNPILITPELILSDFYDEPITYAVEGNTVFIQTSSNEVLISKVNFQSVVVSAGWTPDNKYLFVETEDRELSIWGIEDVVLESPNPELILTGIMDYKFSPNGSLLLVNRYIESAIDYVELWDVELDSPLFGEEYSTVPTPRTQIEWSPNGQQYACIDGSSVDVWDAYSLQLLHSFSNADNIGNSDGFFDVSWSPDMSKLAVLEDRGMALIYSLYDGVYLNRIPSGIDWVEDIDWSPDGTSVVLTFVSSSPSVWDAEPTPWMMELSPNSYDINTPYQPEYLSPNGELIFRENVILDSKTGEPITHLDTLIGSIIASWNPNNDRVLVRDYTDTMKVYDVYSGEVLAKYNDTYVIRHAMWSSDGNFIITENASNEIKVWGSRTSVQKILDIAESDIFNGRHTEFEQEYYHFGEEETFTLDFLLEEFLAIFSQN